MLLVFAVHIQMTPYCVPVQVLLSTRDTSCLKKFLSLQGLKLLWSWMIDSGDKDTNDIISFRIQVNTY